MSTDEIMFFDKMPQILPLYQTLREKLQIAYPDTGLGKINNSETKAKHFPNSVMIFSYHQQK